MVVDEALVVGTKIARMLTEQNIPTPGTMAHRQADHKECLARPRQRSRKNCNRLLSYRMDGTTTDEKYAMTGSFLDGFKASFTPKA